MNRLKFNALVKQVQLALKLILICLAIGLCCLMVYWRFNAIQYFTIIVVFSLADGLSFLLGLNTAALMGGKKS